MVEIRQLTCDEVKKYSKELTRFMYMCLSENEDGDFKALSEKYYNDMVVFSEEGSAVLIGAFDGENLVGFHWGYERTVSNTRVMHSYFNAIEPDYRGEKIGSRFFRKLEQIAKDRGIKEIEAMCSPGNEIAVNYHLHNGFRIVKYKFIKEL